MLELRFHGRGGQGVVLLGKLVARLFFQLGKHVKEFPRFGVERRGAPVEGYVRVDDRPIALACQIYHPDVIVVMSETILDGVDVTAGVEPGSLILVNSGRPASWFAGRLAGFAVATVDADAIALGHGLGTPLAPIANTTLFGAFGRLMEVEAREVEAALRSQLKSPGRNVAAALEAYGAVSDPHRLPGEPARPAPRPAAYTTLAELPEQAYSSADARGNRTGSWRSQRPRYAFKRAPCNALCPAGNDVRGFLEALAQGDPVRSLEILLRTSPFPGVCGRVCPHPCEDECNRSPLDGAVAVRALERYAAAYGGEVEIPREPSTGRRVAVVGAGPAGLSAAWQLARRGHAVVVLEAGPEPGGMLAVGIPSFRLPRDVLRREVERIVRIGVHVRCNTALGADVSLARLREEYDAVLLAVGRQVSATLGIAGEDLTGVEHGLGFLRRHNLGQPVTVGEAVVVIGGGNTAIDVAGVCLRTSATGAVTIVYRRGRAQMPAIPEEIEQVLEEGASLVELASPVEVVAGPQGRVRALACVRMALGEPDAGGRPRPIPIAGSRFEIPCDQVILATGQLLDLGGANEVAVHDDLVTTNLPAVYLCGDASTAAGTVSAAIGSGRAAALAIHEALGGAREEPAEAWAPSVSEVLRFERINPAYFPPQARAEAPRLPTAARRQGFAEVLGEIPGGCAEAARCLSCGTCNGCDTCYLYCPEPAVSRRDGAYRFDLDYCKGCGICFEECPRGVIDMGAEG